MASISFDVEALGNVKSKFESLESGLETIFSQIKGEIENIDSMWSGPVHDTAKADCELAKKHLADASHCLAKMYTAILKIEQNARKVSY